MDCPLVRTVHLISANDSITFRLLFSKNTGRDSTETQCLTYFYHFSRRQYGDFSEYRPRHPHTRLRAERIRRTKYVSRCIAYGPTSTTDVYGGTPHPDVRSVNDRWGIDDQSDSCFKHASELRLDAIRTWSSGWICGYGYGGELLRIGGRTNPFLGLRIGLFIPGQSGGIR